MKQVVNMSAMFALGAVTSATYFNWKITGHFNIWLIIMMLVVWVLEATIMWLIVPDSNLSQSDNDDPETWTDC